MIRNYRSDKIPKSCIVIGSGVGGLSLGALLARRGVRVTILESDSLSTGGLSQTIKGDGYHFSFGPRYLWNFGEGELGWRFLRHCGIEDRVKMVELDKNGFDHVFVGKSAAPIKVPNDWFLYRDNLKKIFPEDRRGIDRFFDLCHRSYLFLRFADENMFYFRSWPYSFAKIISKFAAKPFEIVGFCTRMGATLQNIFDQCRLSKRLQAVLFGHGLIFAEPQQTIGFYAYVGATLNYMRASYFPAAGMPSMIQALADVILDQGGIIENGAHVSKLETDGKGAIKTVHTDDGRRYTAEVVVANIDPRAVNLMLAKDPANCALSRLPKYRYSRSLTSVFIGLRDAKVLKPIFGPWNVWYCRSPEHVPNLYEQHPEHPPERMYVNSPSMINPLMNDAPPGGATLTAFVPADFQAFKDAAEKSSETHDDLLNRHREVILDVIEDRFVPGIREQIQFIRLISPYEVFTHFGQTMGNVYGKAFRPRDVLIKLPWKSKISNLYYVGQYTAFAGVIPAIMSACNLYQHFTDVSV